MSAESSRFMEWSSSFLETTIEVLAKSQEALLPACRELAATMEQAVSDIQRKRKGESCDFNVFSLFSPSETMHSKILAHLLNPRANHGQGALFLHSFLELIGVADPSKGTWHVSCEAERIDVCLERQHPHSIIIIENKSNWACDQGEQLYRYWLLKMYKCHNQDCATKGWVPFYEENQDRYKILYLTPDVSKQPSDNTKMCPQKDVPMDAPKSLPIKPTPLVFSDLAREWIGKILTQDRIGQSNVRIRDYLQQYVDFWLYE